MFYNCLDFFSNLNSKIQKKNQLNVKQWILRKILPKEIVCNF